MGESGGPFTMGVNGIRWGCAGAQAMSLLTERLGRRGRRRDSSMIEFGEKREGRLGVALFLFGIVALMLAAMLLATVKL